MVGNALGKTKKPEAILKIALSIEVVFVGITMALEAVVSIEASEVLRLRL